ncbi:MAG: riboflavin synthase [Nitriliruptoraceae bacterium]
MFTGLVEEMGLVEALDVDPTRGVLQVAAQTVVEDVAIGDSISVDGCCLTVTSVSDGRLTFDLMAETLQVTALGERAAGDRVNLERAMSHDRRFGGHVVQGHVDTVGTVVERRDRPGTVDVIFRAPGIRRWLVPRGSVTVAGVSLTVVDADAEGTFRVGLIPQTCRDTTLGGLRAGDRVNLEGDVIAKYVERLLAQGLDTPYRGAFDPARHEDDR